jgi:hypothetical protein
LANSIAARKRCSADEHPATPRGDLQYANVHNEEGKPFKWTKTADEVLSKMARFGQRTQQLHGEAP